MTDIHRVNDATATATAPAPDATAGDKLRSDAAPAPGASAGAAMDKSAAPAASLPMDKDSKPEITDGKQTVNLFTAQRNEVAALAPDKAADKAADKATSPFGSLELVDGATSKDKPLSPNMQEARRVEAGYRDRYQANDEAMRSVNGVINAGNPDLAGGVTKDSLDKALANAKNAAPDDKKAGKDFQDAATYLRNNFDSMDMSPYKAKDGSMNKDSAAHGTEQMKGEQEQLEKRILATEMNAVNREKAAQAQQAKPEADAAPSVVPKEALVKQSAARPGEGPYQVAARVLGSDGKTLNDKQLKELTEAFKSTYEDERKADPKINALDGLKVGHEFMNKDNINQVMAKISDPALKERLTKIAGQDVAYKPPVISAIPSRVGHVAHQQAHHVKPHVAAHR